MRTVRHNEQNYFECSFLDKYEIAAFALNQMRINTREGSAKCKTTEDPLRPDRKVGQ
jgi:hypothetical protein